MREEEGDTTSKKEGFEPEKPILPLEVSLLWGRRCYSGDHYNHRMVAAEKLCKSASISQLLLTVGSQ